MIDFGGGLAFLGDTHFGVRNDSLIHANHQRKFFAEMFFPTLKKRGIKKVVQLGDVFDRRKYINFNTLRQAREMFFDPARAAGVEIYIQIGNHDIYWKDTLKLNSPELLLNEYENVHVFNKATSLNFSGFQIDMVPWICKSNEEESLRFIQESKAKILCGHFEISGFEMLRGISIDRGLQSDVFAQFDLVISGHYHTPSNGENICYLGAPYGMTWGDLGDAKRFAILETPDASKIEMISNPFALYHQMIYNDELVNYDKASVKEYADSYLKILVQKRENDLMFDRFIDKIYKKANPADLKIIDGTMTINDEEIANVETQDPLAVLINSVGSDVKGAATIRGMIQDLYTEALTMGNMHD